MTKQQYLGCSGLELTPDQWQRLRQAAEAAGYQLLDLDQAEEKARLSQCDVLFGCFEPHQLTDAASLRWLHSGWAGTDRILAWPGVADGRVLLTNSSGAYGGRISEVLLTWALMQLNHAALYYQAQQEQTWRSFVPGRSLQGLRVTVVGLGDLGRNFSRRCHSLGAQVRGVSRSGVGSGGETCQLYPVSQLDQALAGAELLALCLPGTAGTKGLIDGGRLDLLAPGALVLNVGRGSVLDTDALRQRLHSGALGGAYLDVFTQEPLPADSPLWRTPNLLITPHIAGRPEDPSVLPLILDIFLDNLGRWAEGQPLHHVVDPQTGY